MTFVRINDFDNNKKNACINPKCDGLRKTYLATDAKQHISVSAVVKGAALSEVPGSLRQAQKNETCVLRIQMSFFRVLGSGSGSFGSGPKFCAERR